MSNWRQAFVARGREVKQPLHAEQDDEVGLIAGGARFISEDCAPILLINVLLLQLERPGVE